MGPKKDTTGSVPVCFVRQGVSIEQNPTTSKSKTRQGGNRKVTFKFLLCLVFDRSRLCFLRTAQATWIRIEFERISKLHVLGWVLTLERSGGLLTKRVVRRLHLQRSVRFDSSFLVWEEWSSHSCRIFFLVNLIGQFVSERPPSSPRVKCFVSNRCLRT
jgi:hypothetical protein